MVSICIFLSMRMKIISSTMLFSLAEQRLPLISLPLQDLKENNLLLIAYYRQTQIHKEPQLVDLSLQYRYQKCF